MYKLKKETKDNNGDTMRTYHLFLIKNEFYNAYFKNPVSLYKTLENLYKIDFKSFRFGISLYTQICEMHKIELLQNYFNEICFKKKNNTYFLFNKESYEKTILTVRPSVLVVKTNKNIPHLFRILSYYSSYLFVCDFKNKDYFWLSNQYRKNSSNKLEIISFF